MPYLITYDEMQELTDLDKQREIIKRVLKKLKESNSSNTSISIKEGYLSCKFVGFEFRGNSSAAAYATVSYDGR